MFSYLSLQGTWEGVGHNFDALDGVDNASRVMLRKYLYPVDGGGCIFAFVGF